METLTMHKYEQARLVHWRRMLVQEAETTGNVSATCQKYRISRQAFYEWMRRYAQHSVTGLCDGPRGPKNHPRKTSPQVIEKIWYLRQTYHFGPSRISMYQRRYHDLCAPHSSVHRVLQRHGVSRLPANQRYQPHAKRWKRYEKQVPGHRVQVDVKFLMRIPGSTK